MTVLRAHGVKFEREKNKCSLFLMFWFPKDRGWRMSAIRCSPFHFIHQTNKEEILLETKVSGHSQLERERGYQGWDTAEGTGLRCSWWKVPNGKNTWLNYIPHFMTKIICYSVIHCLRNFHGLGELSFKNVKSFLKQDVE